jgi:hypothetical protein
MKQDRALAREAFMPGSIIAGIPLETADAWLVRDPRSETEQPQMILRIGYGLPLPARGAAPSGDRCRRMGGGRREPGLKPGPPRSPWPCPSSPKRWVRLTSPGDVMCWTDTGWRPGPGPGREAWLSGTNGGTFGPGRLARQHERSGHVRRGGRDCWDRVRRGAGAVCEPAAWRLAGRDVTGGLRRGGRGPAPTSASPPPGRTRPG